MTKHTPTNRIRFVTSLVKDEYWSPFDNLPNELMYEILGGLEYFDLIVVQRVGKTFKAVAEHILQKRYGSSPAFVEDSSNTSDSATDTKKGEDGDKEEAKKMKEDEQPDNTHIYLLNHPAFEFLCVNDQGEVGFCYRPSRLRRRGEVTEDEFRLLTDTQVANEDFTFSVPIPLDVFFNLSLDEQRAATPFIVHQGSSMKRFTVGQLAQCIVQSVGRDKHRYLRAGEEYYWPQDDVMWSQRFIACWLGASLFWGFSFEVTLATANKRYPLRSNIESGSLIVGVAGYDDEEED